MKPKYLIWITENVTNNGYGQCAEVTLAMQKAFPELMRVRGIIIVLPGVNENIGG